MDKYERGRDMTVGAVWQFDHFSKVLKHLFTDRDNKFNHSKYDKTTLLDYLVIGNFYFNFRESKVFSKQI